MFDYDATLPAPDRLRVCRQQIAEALEAAERARNADLRQGYLRIAAGWASMAMDLEFEMEATSLRVAGQSARRPDISNRATQ